MPVVGPGPAGPGGGWTFGSGHRPRRSLSDSVDQLDVALRRRVPGDSVWALAAGAILAVFALAWLEGFLEAVRHHPATGQDRALALFSPASLGYAALLLLGVVIIDMGRHFGRTSVLDRPVLTGLAVAAVVVIVGAVISIIIELTYFSQGIDVTVQGIVHELMVLAVGAAAAVAAWRARDRSPAAV